MISCKRATELLSKSMDEKLSLAEKVALKVHVKICCYCKDFGEHIKILGKVLGSDKGGEDIKLPGKKKKEIIEKIKSKDFSLRSK